MMSAPGQDPAARIDLAASIKTAWALVEESGVPQHIQEAAFSEVLRAILDTEPRAAGTDNAGAASLISRSKATRDAEGGEGEKLNVLAESDILRRVSDETGVPVDRLERVIHVDDGVVKLIGQHTKYGTTTTDQARTVAEIVTVVRKVGMGQSDTSFEIIKEACESKHCYDSKNFAYKHMQGIDGFVVKGESKNRRLEARGSGITAFAALIDKLLGTA